MKVIKHLNVLENYKDIKNLKKDLVSTKGSYDKEHYKKYWLKEHLNQIYSCTNAEGLALKEYSDVEFKKIAEKQNVVIKEINPTKDSTFVSAYAKYMDFETEKYNYYSVTEEFKTHYAFHTARVLK